jgi:hypothetical protein
VTPLERAAILKAQSRVSRLQPDMTARILKAWAIIRESLSEAELTRMIDSGFLDRIIQEVLSEPDLDRAFLAFRQEIRQTVEDSYTLSIRDTPKAGKIEGVQAIAFDHLSEHVRTAIQKLETPVLTSLKDDIRETVRAAIRQGLDDGVAPRTVARGLRDVIGLGKNQLEQVQNFRDALEGKNGRTLTDYTLRNKRIDAMLEKGPLTAEQVDRYTEVYRKRRIAENANVVAQTTTRSAYKSGQALSWADAEEKGVIPEGFQAVKTWVHFDPQPNPRPEHQALNGETVPASENYSNGDSYAGEGDPWNCHCLDRFSIARI